MKSHEYVDQYGDQIYRELREGKTDTLQKVLKEFVEELKRLVKTRYIKTDDGVRRAIEEENEKWNAFVRKFNKKYKVDVLKTNVFSQFMKDVIGDK